MTETISEESGPSKNDQWQERIAEQERSGTSVRRFCRERGIREHLFYYWRKRLRHQQEPMRFALVDREAARREPAPEANLELVLATGERLRIGAGVNVTTLRAVLEVLRG